MDQLIRELIRELERLDPAAAARLREMIRPGMTPLELLRALYALLMAGAINRGLLSHILVWMARSGLIDAEILSVAMAEAEKDLAAAAAAKGGGAASAAGFAAAIFLALALLLLGWSIYKTANAPTLVHVAGASCGTQPVATGLGPLSDWGVIANQKELFDNVMKQAQAACSVHNSKCTVSCTPPATCQTNVSLQEFDISDYWAYRQVTFEKFNCTCECL